MKALAEQVSIDMGYDGEINSHVLQKANRRLKNMRDNRKKKDNPYTNRERSSFGDESSVH